MAITYFSKARKAAFNRLWALNGRATMQIVPPISQWTLPDGVTYNDNLDQFQNAGGTRVTVPWSSQTTTEVKILPQDGNNQVILGIPGLLTTVGTTVTVKWSTETEQAINNAWGVVIREVLYRIQQWTVTPFGVDQPDTIYITLTEGE